MEFLTDAFGLAVAHNGYIFRTTDGGTFWNVQKVEVTGQIFGRDESLHGVSIVDSGFAVAAGPGGTVFRTTNGGISWQSVGYPSLPGTFWIEDVDFVNRNVGWIVGLDQDLGHDRTVYRTTDGGNTWSQAMSRNSYMWAVDFVDEQYGWIATIGELFFRTTNGGATWIQGTLPPSPVTTIVSDMRFANREVGWVVGWYGYVARTTDGGVTWALQDLGGPPDPDILFSVHVVSATEAWATGRESDVTREGVVYHTTNGGISWSRQVIAEDPYWGYAIAGSPSGHVWIGGYEGRILKRTAPTGVGDNGEYEIASAFRLEQNYPNPFNPSTTIRFEVTGSGFLSLKVYNLLGQEVATLVNEQMRPGSYEVQWDASGMPSGVYCYRLSSGGFSETKRMVLLR
ncbi:MAG TPA: YCF48-related protein [Bacteroidota bacterium]|nr:YCF48-related protein [Bacteroidota bacterium]